MTFYWVPIAEAQTPGHEEDSMPLHLIPTPAPQGRLDSLAHLVGRVTWLLVAGVLVAGAGKLLFFPGSARVEPAARTTVAAPPLMPEVLDAALAGALVTCREIAVAEAEQRMAAWHTDLMQRVDDDYLDWYFGYWTQNTLGLKALWHGTLHAVHPASPSAEDRLRQTVRTEFAARVLRPAIAQRELERMTGEVMDVYVAALAQALDAVPETRRIPRGDWNAYLADIGSLVGTTEAARSVDLPAKAMVAASVGGGMVSGPGWRLRSAARWGAASAGRMAGAGLAEAGPSWPRWPAGVSWDRSWEAGSWPGTCGITTAPARPNNRCCGRTWRTTCGSWSTCCSMTRKPGCCRWCRTSSCR